MKKLLLAALLLAGCGGGGETTEPPITPEPESSEYCVELRVRYFNQDIYDRTPIADLYAVAYPDGFSSVHLGDHSGVSYKRYKVSSFSPAFNLDVFMFGSYHSSKSLSYSPNDVVAVVEVETMNGNQWNTTGVSVTYKDRFDGINQLCN